MWSGGDFRNSHLITIYVRVTDCYGAFDVILEVCLTSAWHRLKLSLKVANKKP